MNQSVGSTSGAYLFTSWMERLEDLPGKEYKTVVSTVFRCRAGGESIPDTLPPHLRIIVGFMIDEAERLDAASQKKKEGMRRWRRDHGASNENDGEEPVNSGHMPAEDMPAGDMSAGDMPAEDVPAGDVPSDEPLPEETFIGETLNEETLNEETLIGETLIGETLIGETPGETPGKEAPAGNASRSPACSCTVITKTTEDHGGSQRTTEDHGESQNRKDTDTDTDTEKDKENEETRTGAPAGGACARVPLKDAFRTFWSAYPRKQGRGQAENAFRRLNPDAALLETILAALKEQSAAPQWQSDGGRYVPNPATWLNGRRWEDEVTIRTQRERLLCPPPPDTLEDLFPSTAT